MSYIINALSNYILLFFVFCLLEIGLIQYYKRKQIKVKTGFIIGYQVLVCLLITIFTITGIPGIDSMSFETDMHMNYILYIQNIFSFECVMNMIMFMPLGMIIPLLWKKAQKWYLVTMMGFSLSLFIEFIQMFNYRASDINDILTNVLGIILGYIIYRSFLKRVHCFELNDYNQINKIHIFIQIILISLIYFFIGSPIISLIGRI